MRAYQPAFDRSPGDPCSEGNRGRRKLQSWVVTGGIACGKSTVMARLAGWMAAGELEVFSCDEAVRELYEDARVIDMIATRFGREVVVDGRVDRQRLGGLVFEDGAARKELEGMLHPAVLEALEAAREAARAGGKANLFVAEVPLYHEIGGTVAADHVIVVASSPDQQVRRLMQYRGLDKARSESMVDAQWAILDKAAKATRVIWNDGSEEALDDQISALLSSFDPT